MTDFDCEKTEPKTIRTTEGALAVLGDGSTLEGDVLFLHLHWNRKTKEVEVSGVLQAVPYSVLNLETVPKGRHTFEVRLPQRGNQIKELYLGVHYVGAVYRVDFESALASVQEVAK